MEIFGQNVEKTVDDLLSKEIAFEQYKELKLTKNKSLDNEDMKSYGLRIPNIIKKLLPTHRGLVQSGLL